MSDNDLAQAYSILGQGVTATYRNRRKEEEDYRDKVRRDARKDKLISYIAAPILQGASKALVSGATDLVGNLVLGENGKDFFNTEQGRVAARKSRYADTQEKILLKTQTQLTQDGLSETEGQLKLLADGYDEELKLKFGDSPKNAFFFAESRREARPGLEKEAERIVKERQELITYAAQSPDIDVLKARVKQEGSYYGKTKGQKIMSTLVGKLFGKNPAEQGASYILTGSNDPTEAQRILRDNFMSDTYVEDFAKKLAAVDSSKKNAYENAFTEFALENPGVVSAMQENQKQQLGKNLERIQYVNDVDRFTRVYATTDPARGVWYQNNKDKYLNKAGIDSAYFNSIGGFSIEEGKEKVNLYLAEESNVTPVNRLVRAVAFSRTELAGEVIDDPDEFRNTKEYAAVQKSSKEFISNVLVPRFNEDLSLALVNMSDTEKEALLAGEGSREELLRQYITYQIDNNLATESKLFAKKTRAFRIGFSDEMSEENVALLKDPKAGLAFILNQDPEKLTQLAQANGSTSTERSVGTGNPNHVQSNRKEVIAGFGFIADSDQSYVKLRERADKLLAALWTDITIDTRLLDGGIDDDNETVVSATTLADFKIVEKRVSDILSAKFPAGPTDDGSGGESATWSMDDVDLGTEGGKLIYSIANTRSLRSGYGPTPDQQTKKLLDRKAELERSISTAEALRERTPNRRIDPEKDGLPRSKSELAMINAYLEGT